MQLHILGAGGYHPNDLRQTACLMLPELSLVLDAGTAMYRVRDLLAGDRLDILLTHPHLDHVIGLTYLFDVLWQKHVPRVTVYGDEATLQAVDEVLFHPAVFPVKPPFALAPLPDELVLPGGARVTHFPLEHPGGSRGYRLDLAHRSLAYVTDTTAAEDAPYVEQIRGVDLLVHECNFKDDMPQQARLTGHSTTSEVARVAAAAGVGRLVLVHLNALDDSDDPVNLEACRDIFPDATVGRDGMVIEV